MRHLRDTLVWLLLFSIPILMCYFINSRGKLETGEERPHVTLLRK